MISTQSVRPVTVFLSILLVAFFSIVLATSTVSLPFSPSLNQSQLTSTAAISGVSCGDNLFINTELLMNPTPDGVTLRMKPAKGMAVFVRYGENSVSLDKKTPTYNVNTNNPLEIIFRNLKEGTPYFYQVYCAPNDGTGRFAPREKHSFTTLPKTNRPFTFFYGTDSHMYDQFTNNFFGGGDPKYAGYLQTMANMASLKDVENPLFLVDGGDTVGTLCNCLGGTYDGINYGPGNANFESKSLPRYNIAYAPQHYGQVLDDIPLVNVLGNHDGEQGWPGTTTELVYAASMSARLKTLANASKVYSGGPEGRYFAFEVGETGTGILNAPSSGALIVVIDVMGENTVKPQTADDWSLGTEQLAWLDYVLHTSNAKWKFIFAEHADGGGISPTDAPYYYGRGDLRETVDGLITGKYLGEQALIQQWQEETIKGGGAAFFLSGHDHLYIAPTPKLNEDGTPTRVFHGKGGSAGAGEPSWVSYEEFQTRMDWDYSGIADYYETAEGRGTLEVGYSIIRVDDDKVVFDYMVTDTQEATRNNTVLLSTTIEGV